MIDEEATIEYVTHLLRCTDCRARLRIHINQQTKEKEGSS